MIEQFNGINPDILSLDWRVDIKQAGKILKPEIGIQGNLDPYVASYSTGAASRNQKTLCLCTVSTISLRVSGEVSGRTP